MSDFSRIKPYLKQYEQALKLFYDGDFDGCVASTKYNLFDPTLSPYYSIKNLILLVAALGNWGEANPWRLLAEQAYEDAYQTALHEGDNDSLGVLHILREELNELEEYRQLDLLGKGMEMMEIIDKDMDDNKYSDEYVDGFIGMFESYGAEDCKSEAGSIGDEDGDKDVGVVEPSAMAETQSFNTPVRMIRHQMSIEFNKGPQCIESPQKNKSH